MVFYNNVRVHGVFKHIFINILSFCFEIPCMYLQAIFEWISPFGSNPAHDINKSTFTLASGIKTIFSLMSGEYIIIYDYNIYNHCTENGHNIITYICFYIFHS